MELAVLLRNCPHDNTDTGATLGGVFYERYALKCDTFSIQIAKTPIQVPIPQDAPEIIDIGFYRPSLSIGGIVDTVGGDTTNTSVAGFENMEVINVSRKNNAGANINNVKYYIPYKNKLEEIVYKWITTADDALELEIGDAQYPIYNRLEGSANAASTGTTTGNPFSETGGGVYIIAIQQARFQVDPAQEDRWQFQMQFVCESRKDVTFS